MEKLVKNIWLIILAFTGYDVWNMWQEHQTRMDEKLQNIPSIEAKIKKNKRKVKELKSYFKDITEAKERIARVALDVEKLQRKFPSKLDDSQYLSLISSLSEAINIRNVHFSPGPEVDNGFYFTKSYLMKGRGTYLQFLILLEKLSTDERLLNIAAVSFAPAKVKQKGRFKLLDVTLSIEAYRYDEGHVEETGIKDIEQKFIDKKSKKGRKGKKKKKKKKRRG